MSEDELVAWMRNAVAAQLNMSPAGIAEDEDLQAYGMDSLGAVMLTGDLEDLLGREIDPTVAFDFRSLRRLARHLMTSEVTT